MNILILRPRIEVGGVSTVTVSLCVGLLKRGHHPMVATAEEELPGFFAERNVPVFYLPLYPSNLSNLWGSVRQLLNLVQKHQIDVLHSTHRFTTIVGKIVNLLTKTPLVVAIHEFHEHTSLPALLWTDSVNIVPSEALKNHLVSDHRVDERTIYVIAHGIDSNYTLDSFHLEKLRLSLLNDSPVRIVGYIGRLSHEKGVDYFIEAVALLQHHLPALQALIIGDGPLKDTLAEQAHTLGTNINFLGRRDDVRDLLGIIDVVMIPSRSESLSVVALESMAAGRPVVATRVGALPEIIQDGVNGFLVSPGSPQELADRVYTLLVDEELRDKMGKASRELVIAKYSNEFVIEQYCRLYEKRNGKP